MADERLFGTTGAESMYFDLASAYESQVEPYHDDHDLRPQVIEEWSVRPFTSHVPSIDQLIDWVCETVADDGELDEDGCAAFEHAGEQEDVRLALQAAVDLWASKVRYRMADKHLRTYTITWDPAGEPSADGESMYVKATHTESQGFRKTRIKLRVADCRSERRLMRTLEVTKTLQAACFSGVCEVCPTPELCSCRCHNRTLQAAPLSPSPVPPGCRVDGGATRGVGIAGVPFVGEQRPALAARSEPPAHSLASGVKGTDLAHGRRVRSPASSAA